jgi:hypothetical protein
VRFEDLELQRRLAWFIGSGGGPYPEPQILMAEGAKVPGSDDLRISDLIDGRPREEYVFEG